MARTFLKDLLKEQVGLFNEELHLQKLSAKDAMIRPTLFYQDDGIEKIIRKLKKEDCNVCVVIGKDKRFLGEIMDDDLIRVMAHTALNDPITKNIDRCYKRELSWKKAKDLALKHKNIVLENTPINQVLEIVYKKKNQNLIVTNKKNEVVGVITLSSLLRLLSKY